MKFVQINWKPTDRQLRQFALIAMVAIPFLGWRFGGGNLVALSACAAIGAGLALISFFAPQALKPLFVGAMLLTAPLGAVVSELALLVLFFGVFLPIGLFFRLLGRDNLQLRLDRKTASYWQPRRQAAGVDRYYRQS